MKLEDVILKVRKAEKAIRARGVLHIFVFGSTVRGDARRNSDVDMFIDRDATKPMGLPDLVGLQRHLGEVVGATVDLGTRGGLHPLIRESVERTAVKVF